MENNPAIKPQKNTKKILWFSLGALALGTLTFFGIKSFNKSKNNNNEKNNDFPDDLDVENSHLPAVNSKRPTALPDSNRADSFPLRLGAQGDKVKLLQTALIRAYGAGILKKYGVDGYFGRELSDALRAKGYAIPLSQTDYQSITKQPETKKAKVILFVPERVAYGLYNAILAKNIHAALSLVTAIKNTNNYSLVSEAFKKYKIRGVRQTPVNALLNVFDGQSQKQAIQQALKNIGLVYRSDTGKWALNGNLF